VRRNRLIATNPLGAKSSALCLKARLYSSEIVLEEVRLIPTAEADIEGDKAVVCF
jgi:hypothetical protein